MTRVHPRSILTTNEPAIRDARDGSRSEVDTNEGRWTAMDLGLEGRKAIVTGGSRGIGRAAADALAAEGCHVGICARGEEGVDDTVRTLEARGVRAFGRALDVADGPALVSWVADAADALGGLDIVVANVSALAGTGDEASWTRTFEVDVMHTVRTVEAALPFLRDSEVPSILIVSSVSARQSDPSGGGYGPLKAGLIRYAKGLAVNLAPEGIRANVVSPGTIYLEDGYWGRVERESPEMFEGVMAANPMGRMGTPDEVGRAIAFLASPASSFTTGANLVIDGAITPGVQL